MIFFPLPAFLDDSYKTPLDFCANRYNRSSGDPEGQADGFADGIEKAHGGFAECHFVYDESQQAACDIINAKHAFCAGARIAEQQQGNTQNPEHILGGNGKRWMPDASAPEPERIEQQTGRNAEQHRAAK